MNRLLMVLLALSAVTLATGVVVQASEGSRLPSDFNTCALCHGTPEFWEKDQQRLFISKEHLAEDVHFLAGVKCHDCHGGNRTSFELPEAHSTNVDENETAAAPFRLPLSEVRKSCGECHKEESHGLAAGVHHGAGERDHQGEPAPPACDQCHGEVKHNLLPAGDPRSPVFLDNQVRHCGGCHEEALAEYKLSVHGHGLVQSGLLVTAVCADCHGAHAVYPASDERSTLHAANVGSTCGQCHRLIEQRLQKSVHGAGNLVGTQAEETVPGDKPEREPSCTDCHQGHDLPHPKSARFRLGLSSRCGNCHEDLTNRYGMSLHGALSQLGYSPAADCSDCHGAHDILPVSNPHSALSPANRQKTCAQCHPRATGNFLDFDPHADHHSLERDPLLFCVYVVLLTFLFCTFGVFGLHSLLWFARGLVDVSRHGRPKALAPGTTAYVRFGTFHRVGHTVMVISFLGLAATGLPLKYSEAAWAHALANALGGFESTAVWHRVFGVVNIACLAVYVFRMLRRLAVGPENGGSRIGQIFGPDSPVPNLRDLKDFFKMVRWFLGRGPKPTFERWAYWEKFDFWGACADIVIIGSTGLILWFPNLFCAYLPGSVLNVAKVIHSTQALLATGFVFAIHFFATHLRPEKFPMDMSVLTGLVTEEDLREERPEYFERMRRTGKLDELKATVPSRNVVRFVALGGFVALAIGLSLLTGIVLAVVQGLVSG